MSEAGVVHALIPHRHRDTRDHDSRQCIEDRDSHIPENFLSNYNPPFDDYIAESWLPQPSPSWNAVVDPRDQWSPGLGLLSRPLGNSRQGQEDILYAIPHIAPDPQFIGPDCGISIQLQGKNDPALQAVNQMGQYFGDTFHSQTPVTTHPGTDFTICGTSSFQVPLRGYPELHHYGNEFIHEQPDQLWHTPEIAIVQKSVIDTDSYQGNQWTNSSPHGLILDWSHSEQPSIPSKSVTSIAPVPKRKAVSDGSPTKSSPTKAPRLSAFVDVFENSPGALASVKRRKKLDAPVRKAAREVRKAGACHQCRFRKRTCSTGIPCASCLKSGNGLLEIRCQRESPFIGALTHQYFEHSSKRRIVSFYVNLPLKSLDESVRETVTIDGIGRISHTIQLPARRAALSYFSRELQNAFKQTEDSKKDLPSENDPMVVLLEDGKLLGTQLEQWALEYTSKYVHAAGPKFYSTTLVHILGTRYVNKGLSESALVAAMLRAASISFVLRAGVKFTTTSPKPPSRFRTIQAKVDTILYQRLQRAEKEVHQRLQRLIFRSAGCLSREQVYPVALVLWQVLRFCCIAASHLSNIAQRWHSNVLGPADYQHHGLKLVLSTHMALFRSSNPLLLDMSDTFNQDLIGGDEQLIALASEMRNVLLTFRQKGSRELKGSITYRKEYFELFRKIYDSK